jgi:hypothetical protein
VARDIVTTVAEDELPLFDASSELFLSDPRRIDPADGDEMLGFGSAEVELLTPVILSVTSGVVTYLVKAIGSAAAAEGKVIVQQRVRQMFKRFREDTPAAPPPLTREQLAEVRQVAIEIATRMRVNPEQARLLADATVGQLAPGPT